MPAAAVEAARDLDQDTLNRHRRVLGADHPDTLRSAHSLANDLRALTEVQAAGDLDQDTLDRRRRVLGADHPETLFSAGNLAADLYALGEVQAARDLDRDTLDRRRRVLGADHPDTINSASNLAAYVPPRKQIINREPSASCSGRCGCTVSCSRRDSRLCLLFPQAPSACCSRRRPDPWDEPSDQHSVKTG